ncbi:glycosyltransferase [Weissella muntiaci]|uniref:Glycosyltransferase n=1 Tax=Weissella muntiaci TaxID=2508881 RepID=A0A6C2C2S4_9LACO|nr:glycosyltransferase family 2 protein [Weissella muntiaci]TYC48092.1 glycosyltransferase [Weissella muntiaci]
MLKRKLAIILPAYNEEEVINKTTQVLSELLQKMILNSQIASDSFIMYVDDGSADRTWELINELSDEYGHIKGLKFSHNFGHQNALIAGLTEVTGSDVDFAVTIDADLQDDPNAIIEMVELATNENKDIVYGVRNDRTSDTWFKRQTAGLFYKFMNWLGVKTIPNHADFRLVNQKVLGAFQEYTERDMFLRGIFPVIGFNSAEVFYARAEREAGETKYPLKKMLQFATSGITSFSVVPITLVRNVGLLISGISILMLIYIFIGSIMQQTQLGWPSLMVSIWFLGGIQLTAIGVIGEYIGKIFMEVKHRPRYIVAERRN